MKNHVKGMKILMLTTETINE